MEGYVGQGNSGSINVALKPLDERKISADAVINRLRPKLNRLPIASGFFPQSAQDLRIEQQVDQCPLSIHSPGGQCSGPLALGPDPFEQHTNASRLPGCEHGSTKKRNLDEKLTFDRAMMARTGLTSQATDSALYDAFGQAEVSIIYTRLNQYYVVLEVAPRFSQSPAGLNYAYPAASSYGAVPLKAVTTARDSTTPIVVNHTGFLPSVTVSFNLAQGIFLKRRYAGDHGNAEPAGHAGDHSRLLCRQPAGLSTIPLRPSRFWLRPRSCRSFIILGMLSVMRAWSIH